MVRRRAVLLGGVAAAAGILGAGCAAVDRGLLPGRARMREALGLTGEDGAVPGVPEGRVRVSVRDSGARGTGVEMITMVPDGVAASGLPVVVSLHGAGGRARDCVGLGLPRFLTAAARAGVPPFAAVAVDGGGDSYWHARRPGDDPLAMLLEELPRWLASEGLGAPSGALGWSMGGSGALQYARRRPLRAVAVLSPALFPTYEATRAARSYDSRESWLAHEPLCHPSDRLTSHLGVWCGEDDPFYEPSRRLAAQRRPERAEFAPGLHTGGYWRRVLPDAVAFLGRSLRAS